MHVLTDKKLSHGSVRLLLALQHMRSPVGLVRDTHEEIAEQSSISKRTVRRLIEGLEYLGYLNTIFRPSSIERRRGVCNVHVVLNRRTV